MFLVSTRTTVAKLRLLWSSRRRGGSASAAGWSTSASHSPARRATGRLTLWTNDVLVAARKIYQAAGFRLVKEEAHRSFGKDLIGQTWDLDL